MEKFKEFPAINFNFSQLIRDNVEEALSGVKGANSIKLFGNDLETLEKYGQRVLNILNRVPGIANVGLFHIVGQPNLEIQIDRQQCARYGINVADVEAVVQVAIGGGGFTQMVEGEKIYDIVLRLPVAQRDDPEVIGRIPVDAPSGPGRQAGRADPARATGQDRAAQARRDLHLPREQPALHPDQVQRAGPRPGLDHPRGRGQGQRPQVRRDAAQGLQHRLGGRVRPDAGGQRAADVDRAALDRADPGAALHRVQLDQGRAAGHGQRGRGDDGGRLGAEAHRDAVLDLGGRRVHLDLRRRGPGRRAPDLVLQPDAAPPGCRSRRP